MSQTEVIYRKEYIIAVCICRRQYIFCELCICNKQRNTVYRNNCQDYEGV